MLSESARTFIRASVPALREHGETICRRFYRNMFAAHPELLGMFPPEHLLQGVQQRALASALLMFAEHVDEPAALDPLIARIASTHTHYRVEPAHYPVAGPYLLDALRDVLGTAATPEFLAAWDEAYRHLAGVLIAAESRVSRS